MQGLADAEHTPGKHFCSGGKGSCDALDVHSMALWSQSSLKREPHNTELDQEHNTIWYPDLVNLGESGRTAFARVSRKVAEVAAIRLSQHSHIK